MKTLKSTQTRAERRAAPKPAACWHDASAGRIMSRPAPSGDRAMYSSTEGSHTS